MAETKPVISPSEAVNEETQNAVEKVFAEVQNVVQLADAVVELFPSDGSDRNAIHDFITTATSKTKSDVHKSFYKAKDGKRALWVAALKIPKTTFTRLVLLSEGPIPENKTQADFFSLIPSVALGTIDIGADGGVMAFKTGDAADQTLRNSRG